MSPGFLSDRRAVIALIIGIPLAIIALVFVKPYDYNISLVVFGISVVLIAFACILDTADEFESIPKATPLPEEDTIPKESNQHAEDYIPAVEKPAAAPEDLPVETIEGIGKVYGKLLRDAGIPTVADMLGVDAERIVEICDVNVAQAERWIAMSRFAWLDEISEEDAEAIVFATGITDLQGLAAANANVLFDKIKDAIANGDVRVPAGYEFTVKKIQKWINEAKTLA
jgi:predicted flap endonuclease-1-like 5' DNA nuclease